MGEAVSEAGPVAASDDEPRRAEQWLADLDLAAVALGVDDPYPGRCHGDVVDVGPGAANSPVVQQHDVFVKMSRE